MDDSDEDDYSFLSLAASFGAGVDEEDRSQLKTDELDDCSKEKEETDDFSPLPSFFTLISYTASFCNCFCSKSNFY